MKYNDNYLQDITSGLQLNAVLENDMNVWKEQWKQFINILQMDIKNMMRFWRKETSPLG